MISILQLLPRLYYEEIKCTVLFNSSFKTAQTFVLAALGSLMMMMMMMTRIRMAVRMMMMTMNADTDGHWLIGLRWHVFRLERKFTPFYVSF